MQNRSKYIVAATAPIIMVVAVLVLLFVFNSADSRHLQAGLVIDHDGGADDAMAIFMAGLYEKYFMGPKLLALTTTFGNVDEAQSFNNTQRILRILNRSDVPIYRGNSKALIRSIESDYYFGYDGLGDSVTEVHRPIPAQREHAVMALIELSKRYRGNLIVVALGALTNIAMAIQLDPMFLCRISQLYVGAGYVHDKNYKDPEFNAAMDAEAYYIVTKNGRPDKVTIVPFSTILNHQNISKEWRVDVLGAIPTKIMQNQNSFERISLNKTSYWSLLDPAAMAIALKETAIVEEAKYSISGIRLCNEDRGVTETELKASSNATNSRIIYDVAKEPYKKLLLDIFSAELQGQQH